MPNPTPTVFVPYHAVDDLHRMGTRALQPVATAVTPGTLYCVTDENNKVERSNGSAWQPYSGGVTTPGGTNTTVQYNNAGVLDGAPQLLYEHSSANPLVRLNSTDTAVFLQANPASAASYVGTTGPYLIVMAQQGGYLRLQCGDVICYLHPNYSFTPAADGGINLGTATYRWAAGNFAGAVIASSFGETGRANQMGYWIPITYNAANFQADQGATWNVPAGNLYINRYSIVGKTLFWQFMCIGSTVTGIPRNLLMVPPLPPEYAHMPNAISMFNNNGALPPTEMTIYDPTRMGITRNDGANHQAGNVILHFTVILSIA